MPEQNWFRLESNDDSVIPDLAIFGVPYDRAAFFRRGAAEAPARMRWLSARLPPVTEDGRVVNHMRVLDLGDIHIESQEIAVDDLHHRIRNRWHAARRRGLPLALGGDHSISIPLFHAAAEWTGRQMGVIWIDAHPDLCDSFHGSRTSHACVLRRALENPMIEPHNVVMLGIRSCEVEEIEYIRSNPMTVLTAQHLAGQDPTEVGSALAHRLGDMPVYLSLDIDAFDPAYAPGTGIPDAGGLTARWVIDLLHGLGSRNLVGVDLVEVSPPLDVASDATSLLALKVILELLGNLAAHST